MGFFTKDIKSLNDLFMHGLQDLYYAENQIMKALPDMIEKATNAALRTGFEKHLTQTEGQCTGCARCSSCWMRSRRAKSARPSSAC